MTTTTAPVTELIAVTLDTPDAGELARFYGSLLGGEVTEYPEYGVASVTGNGSTLYFQGVSDYQPPQWPTQSHPQQIHLDFRVADLKTAVAAASELGATVAPDQPNPDMSTVMIDPHGHPFCLCPPRES